MNYWLIATIIESGVIGLFAGISAYNTFWHGSAGIFLGFLAWGFSFCMLLIRRDEEDKLRFEENERRRKRGNRKVIEYRKVVGRDQQTA